MSPATPPFSSATRTLRWLDACQRSLDEAEDAAVALVRNGRASREAITLLRLRIDALRADIADWRAQLGRRDGLIEPQWTQGSTPWCPPPPPLADGED